MLLHMVVAALLAIIAGAWAIVLGVGLAVQAAAHRKQTDASVLGLGATFVLAVLAVLVTMNQLGVLRF